ncbi:TPA: SAM-dependent methyltransferase, partial [Vibrio cholerae]
LGGSNSPFGSLYFIVARKRTCPLKPIRSKWRLKRRLSPIGVNYRVNSKSQS